MADLSGPSMSHGWLDEAKRERTETERSNETMAELIDSVELASSQSAELFEGGVIWLHDNATFQDIKLEAKAATLLFDFLGLHYERLIRHRDAQASAAP